MRIRLMKELIEWAKALGFALIVAALILIFARPSVVVGESMLPTFNNGDIVLVERISQFFAPPKQGDIVVAVSDIKLNNFMKKNLIKRIIALQGDQVDISDGSVFINGEKINEPYLYEGSTNGYFHGVVPDGHVFVMGDNRFHSNDSRSSDVGYVPVSRLKGRVYLRIWPLKSIKLF